MRPTAAPRPVQPGQAEHQAGREQQQDQAEQAHHRGGPPRPDCDAEAERGAAVGQRPVVDRQREQCERPGPEGQRQHELRRGERQPEHVVCRLPPARRRRCPGPQPGERAAGQPPRLRLGDSHAEGQREPGPLEPAEQSGEPQRDAQQRHADQEHRRQPHRHRQQHRDQDEARQAHLDADEQVGGGQPGIGRHQLAQRPAGVGAHSGPGRPRPRHHPSPPSARSDPTASMPSAVTVETSTDGSHPASRRAGGGVIPRPKTGVHARDGAERW